MIQWALKVVGLDALQDRPVNSLSGGQQQCAWIAMTLAQGSAYLLLDEPTSNLDACHQLEIMELLVRLNREERKTIVMVLHDLNLAAQFADQLIVLAGGDLQAFGPPAQVLDAALIERLYQVPVQISHDQSGTPFLRTLRRQS